MKSGIVSNETRFQLKPGGKASSCQEIKLGDLLVGINSSPTSAMTHTQAEQEIKRAQSSLNLSIQRLAVDLVYHPSSIVVLL